MSRKGKFRWISHIFRGGVLTISAVSRVAASVLPAGTANVDNANLEHWNTLRSELSTPEAAQTVLPPEVQDVVETADLDGNLREPVVLSYSLAQPEHFDALDSYWVEKIVRSGDSHRMAEFVTLRSSLDLNQASEAGVFMDWYLWEASGGGGGCDDDAAGSISA